MNNYNQDPRIVMTLDAGGTNFRFSAIRGCQPVVKEITIPSNGDNLERCLDIISEGFAWIKTKCPAPPSAISFAFPGPADYSSGVIGDLVNLPAFRGGIALGPMLEDKFKLPVFINNDADLFAYGEAIAGFLPYVNGLLEKAGSRKHCKNLLGVTIGTGLGGGIVCNGDLFTGDNSMAGEIWAMRNKLNPMTSAEEGASLRAVRNIYAREKGIALSEAPNPYVIEKIALGEEAGDKNAALEAYRRLGEVAGDAIANALTLIDGLVVIGGGIAKGSKLFMPALIDELNGVLLGSNGNHQLRRRASTAFNLEEPSQLEKFLRGEARELIVPGSNRKIIYDALHRVGVGISRLGTSEAVAIGAYHCALQRLDGNGLKFRADADRFGAGKQCAVEVLSAGSCV
ncbi:MAG TPA: ROK family protein [Verrucomicrobiae bacterium]|jgi:glucokinase